MKTVRISRKRWTRGNRKGLSALRTETGQSCCLGFVCRAFGLRTYTGAANISDLNFDAEKFSVLPEKLRPFMHHMDWTDTDLHADLVAANDADALEEKALDPDWDREKAIKILMKKAGIRAIFVP